MRRSFLIVGVIFLILCLLGLMLTLVFLTDIFRDNRVSTPAVYRVSIAGAWDDTPQTTDFGKAGR
jgi:hypothetical protein